MSKMVAMLSVVLLKAFDYVDYWLLFSKLFESSSVVKLWLCTRLFAYWYCSRLVYVRWGSVISEYFHVLTGVRQGGVLIVVVLCLFRFFVGDIIQAITRMNIGCSVGGSMINLLCFADDMVLIAPSWMVYNY